MRRIVMVLAVAVVMALMMAASAAPAFAGVGTSTVASGLPTALFSQRDADTSLTPVTTLSGIIASQGIGLPPNPI